MSDVLKHRFTSPKIDSADTTQVQPSHWNDGHRFQGGAHGEVLTRDTADASFGAKWGPMTSVVGSTLVGTVNDWAPGLAGNTFIQWSGATNLTVTGIAGGLPGQTVTILNTGGAVLSFVVTSSASQPANRLYNQTQSTPTPIGFYGSVTYCYNGGGWMLVAHDPGGPIGYAPIWTTTTTAPILGNGALAGFYRIRGRHVAGQVSLNWGTTTASPPGGAFIFSLPVPCNTAAKNYQHGGMGMLFDASAGTFAAAIHLFTNATFVLYNSDALSTGVMASVPFVWTSPDQLTATFAYEID